MNKLSRAELFCINLIGWTLTILALLPGGAFVGLVMDGLVLPR